MPHPHAIPGGGDIVVARIHRGHAEQPLSPQDVEHVRDLAYESLTRELDHLQHHAEDAWMGETPRCGEDAETAAMHIRNTFAVLDKLGWNA
jgi:hypothetical protein